MLSDLGKNADLLDLELTTDRNLSFSEEFYCILDCHQPFFNLNRPDSELDMIRGLS